MHVLQQMHLIDRTGQRPTGRRTDDTRRRATRCQYRPVLGLQSQTPGHLATEQPARLQPDQLTALTRQQVGIDPDRPWRLRHEQRQALAQPTGAQRINAMTAIGQGFAQRQVHQFDILGKQLLHREWQSLAHPARLLRRQLHGAGGNGLHWQYQFPVRRQIDQGLGQAQRKVFIRRDPLHQQLRREALARLRRQKYP